MEEAEALASNEEGALFMTGGKIGSGGSTAEVEAEADEAIEADEEDEAVIVFEPSSATMPVLSIISRIICDGNFCAGGAWGCCCCCCAPAADDFLSTASDVLPDGGGVGSASKKMSGGEECCRWTRLEVGNSDCSSSCFGFEFKFKLKLNGFMSAESVGSESALASDDLSDDDFSDLSDLSDDFSVSRRSRSVPPMCSSDGQSDVCRLAFGTYIAMSGLRFDLKITSLYPIFYKNDTCTNTD